MIMYTTLFRKDLVFMNRYQGNCCCPTPKKKSRHSCDWWSRPQECCGGCFSPCPPPSPPPCPPVNYCGTCGICGICGLCCSCCGSGRTVYVVPAATYSVSYLANGGTGAQTDSGLSAGAQYTVKSNTAAGITRAGYTFTGWNTQENGEGTAYAAGSTIPVTGNVTLYAQWREG